MKKIILIVFAILIFALPVLAIINGMTLVRESDVDASYEIGVRVEQGWNLLAGVGVVTDPNGGAIRGGDIQISDISVMWAFLPTTQEYVRAYPNPETEKLQAIDDNELLSTSFWVYSGKSGVLRFTSEPIYKIRYVNLYSGWNFVAITPEMTGKKFSELFAACTAERAYAYNNKVYTGHDTPSWEKVYPETVFTKETEGLGMVVKLTESCKMSGGGTVVSAPPALPK